MHRFYSTLAVTAALALGAPMAVRAETGFSSMGFHTADPAKTIAVSSYQTSGSGEANGFKACATGQHIKGKTTCGGGAKAAEATVAGSGGGGAGKVAMQDLHKTGAGTMTLSGNAKSLTTSGAQPGPGPHAIADQANSGTLISYKAGNTYNGNTTVNAGTVTKANATTSLSNAKQVGTASAKAKAGEQKK